MSTPTEEQINHLQSLLDAGTPGEWRFDGREVVVEHKFPRVSRVAVTVNSEDSDLLAELHNLAPALLEAARENLRLREALEESLALNINVFSNADAETCSYYSERTTVIKQAKEALGKETA